MLRSDCVVGDQAHRGPAARSAASVSVVLPAFNEAATIGDVVRGAQQATPNLSEVLVVDDGSGDDTAVVAADAGATVIRHPRNRGKGEALRSGCRAATGGILLFLDADGQDDVAEIPLLLDALQPGVAMAIGSRFAGRLLDGSITTLNRFGNRMLTRVFNGLYGSAISDTQAGFRAVRRDSIDPEALRARAYEIETEMLIHVLRRGGRVVEVPVTRHPRGGGATSFLPMYHGLRILGAMLAGKLSPAPDLQGLS
jgi:glycosyltransferase involved in cell wall biosynthesis